MNTILDAHDAVQRSRQVKLVDLAADLTAAALDDGGSINTAAMLTRPTLLRRVAGLIAEHLTPGVDRVIATAEDSPLATAVSLHSGCPFAIVTDLDHDVLGTIGELHPGEDVAVVSTTTPPHLELWREVLARKGIGIVVAVSAIALPGDENRFVYRLSPDGLHPLQG